MRGVVGDRTYHEFSLPDESPGTDTGSRMGNDSSKYSLGVDLGTDSQSKSSDSRYSLGVDTSLSGDSKSQGDRTETENSSRSESWTSRFSLGIEIDSTTSSRYSLGVDKSLGIGSESTSSRFSLGIFEPTSPSFPLRTGEQLPGDITPARPNDPKEAPSNKPENQASTSATTENKDQQKSSSQASGNSTNVTDKIKEFIHDINEKLKGYVKDAFKIFDNEANEKKTKQEVNTKQQYTSPQKSLLTNPVPGAQVGSGFGFRKDPLKKTAADKMHWGLDIKAPTGTPVQSAGDGKATVIKNHEDYGNFVVIDHGNGLQTSYAHMDSVSIKNHESVKQGQEIGKVGNTGRSTGPHLHFEVRNGDKRGASFHKDKEKYYKDPKDYVSFGK
jgi:murein DD-endopeptidase MepM/ murein hydrolase activator NlpD